jgi:hypothetical protein
MAIEHRKILRLRLQEGVPEFFAEVVMGMNFVSKSTDIMISGLNRPIQRLGTAPKPSVPSWHMNDGWMAVVCR